VKRYTQKDYDDAVNELVHAITDGYGNKVRAIYAAGSFARGDFVPRRSDVDLYVVAEGDKEELQKDLKAKALEIEQRHFSNLKAVLDDILDLTVTTLQEIREGESFLGAGFEYTNFIKEGKLLWGEDVKELIPKPSAEEQSESAKVYLGKVFDMVSKQERSLGLLRWIPFKLITRKNKERWTRQAFNLIFRTAALLLGSKGVCVSRKEDISFAFKHTTKEEDLCNIMSLALPLWDKWKTEPLNDRETKHLLLNSMKFVKGLECLQETAGGNFPG
jgi:predicted nucleotidyltransferase